MSGMTKELLKIIGMHTEAIVVENDGSYVFINDMAKKLVFSDGEPIPLSEWIPDELLDCDALGMCSSAKFQGRHYIISMSRFEDNRIFTICLKDDSLLVHQDTVRNLSAAIKAPLASISAASNSMLPIIEGSGSEILSKNLAFIYQNYYKLLRLADVLSAYDEMLAGIIRLKPNQIDLMTLCRNLIDTVSLLTKEKGVRIWFTSSLKSASTEADFDKIEYVLLSILSTGLKQGKTGDDIKVNLSCSSDLFIVTVSVFGSIMPTVYLNRVFEPRFQKVNSTEPEDTFGLGLSYSAKVIEAHGGTMIMEIREGQCTVVKFTLPIKSGSSFAEEPIRYGKNGMTPILTYLSDILSLDCFDAKYMD
jgi:hypothetical protein